MPARAAALSTSTDLTCTPLSGPSLRRKPSPAASGVASSNTAMAALASRRCSGSSAVPRTQCCSSRAGARPPAASTACRMRGSSIGPPRLLRHNARITASSELPVWRNARSSASAVNAPLA
ncbi:MAG: hypothetical protein LKCHEGNO_01959 [Burkholderiaceae bacterium]|nr:hypothetical protein [Burkholderiaceae bacterium]